MMETLFDRMMRHLMRKGTLFITYPEGNTRQYGDGTGAPVRVTIHDRATVRALAMNPELGLGESYMNGSFTIEDDDLYGLLTMAITNIASGHETRWQKGLNHTRNALRWLAQKNPAGRARENVAHHYDLSGQLYDLFLDTDKQYSCAYFARPDMTLDEAQTAKKRHIANKLLIEPGMRVLDIGCGWGGMGLTLARDYGAKVVGVTLSEEQHKIANARARAEGLEDRCEFRLMDYRDVDETFDRIVSVGMFEHVGVPHYREYFRQVREKLSEDGVALIHTIGRTCPPGHTNPWITKYIFPGGYCPSMSEAVQAIEKEDLYTCDIEVWRLHYAETLRHWHDRFMANRDRVAALYDERFCRMWRFYLVACELTFRLNDQCVFQFQLAPKQENVPLTRDYLYGDDVSPAKTTPARHAAE
ncbi:cyclopropane-fatty-acyl-phospholipid synthase [Psychromarinibacter sp. C21-152]|uniref:Cyclopropane-fatty-acyl-phospholipid synthase n=1 Tax=Psychromarinibacter sediminicola TaxID=3033385 RepID=A0AAE3T723_9RHOB|nr:cyclopropane-fatty-acyl-phospholipid synthase family protein [Psychromarinibacter sediminicola]MDF0599168.1 cyclopropane-fatty-acyl-phospholipid synthase [Psychromarinibacter sediminicola]